MEKIAIISDVHANLEALKATLNDIKNRGITRIFCLGDIISKGVHNIECLKLIKENCEVILQGNCDYYFATEHNLDEKNETEKNRIIDYKRNLTDEDKEYLLSLPLCHEFYMSGKLIRLFHASPITNSVAPSIFASIEAMYEEFLPTDYTGNDIADVAIYGHIHTQTVRKLYNRILLNSGSVGNSIDYIRNKEKDASTLNSTNAQYLVIEGEFGSKEHSTFSYQFIEVPYDIDKELQDSAGRFEYDAYVHELKSSEYRDMPKVYRIWEKDGVDISKI